MHLVSVRVRLDAARASCVAEIVALLDVQREQQVSRAFGAHVHLCLGHIEPESLRGRNRLHQPLVRLPDAHADGQIARVVRSFGEQRLEALHMLPVEARAPRVPHAVQLPAQVSGVQPRPLHPKYEYVHVSTLVEQKSGPVHKNTHSLGPNM